MNAAHSLHEMAQELTRLQQLERQLLMERGTHLAAIARLQQENANLKQMIYGTTSVPSHENN